MKKESSLRTPELGGRESFQINRAIVTESGNYWIDHVPAVKSLLKVQDYSKPVKSLSQSIEFHQNDLPLGLPDNAINKDKMREIIPKF